MPTLRAVPPTERAPRRKKPLGIVQAATRGTHQDLLNALQLKVATAIEDPKAHPRDLAALSRLTLEIAKELQALDTTPEEDPVGQAARIPDEPWQGI